ncbi:MAG: TAXI family TRAP transporter solute-binding subunit [Spirochaetia bacterium]|nr:TAXI family TRAP transporter solute-binding subunit [Spirochaetia bacterium]
MKKIFRFCCCICMLMLLFACSGKTAGDNKKKYFNLFTIKSSYLRTPFYNAGISLAYIINKNTEYIAMNSSYGLSENEKIQSLVDGSASVAFISGPEAYMAYSGHPDYWDDSQNIRALFGFIPTVYNCVAYRSAGIKTLEDLSGKQIVLDSVQTVTGNLLAYLLELNGITGSNTQIYRMRETIGENLFKRQDVDVMWYPMGREHAFFRDINVKKDTGDVFYLIPCLEKNKLKEFLSVYPVFYTDSFSHGSISCEKSLMAYSCLACSGDMDDELAYRITKLWFENIDYIGQFFDSYHEDDARMYACNVPLPFHAGAERYLRESGLLK